MQTFIAFPASSRLHNNTHGFIERMKGGSRVTEAATMEAIMTDFTSEALHTFFVLPSAQLGLSSTMMKIVSGTVATIKGAAHMVVKRTAPKLNLAENVAMAEYMDLMRICVKGAQGKDVWCVAFPLRNDLKKQVLDGINLLEAGQVDAARDTLTRFLLKLTDEALFWYFEQPLKLLHLGPILSKLCKVSTETARKASQAVINRVFVKLDQQQLNTVSAFLKELMMDCEPRLPGQSTN